MDGSERSAERADVERADGEDAPSRWTETSAPQPDVLSIVARAVRELSCEARETVYEVDVIIRCHPVMPWQVRRAFWWCVQAGWLARSEGEPDAFVLDATSWVARGPRRGVRA